MEKSSSGKQRDDYSHLEPCRRVKTMTAGRALLCDKINFI